MRRTALAIIPCLFAASAASQVSMAPRFAQIDPTGAIAMSVGAITARNDADKVGIEVGSGTDAARADFESGSRHMTLDFQASHHDGDGVPAANLPSGGVPPTGGTSVERETALDLHTSYVTFDLLPGDFELDLGFRLPAADLDFMATGLSQSVSTAELLAVPVLAGRAGKGMDPGDLESLVGGAMPYGYESTDVTVEDGHLTGRYRIPGGGERLIGSLVGGFRYVLIDAEYDDGSDALAGDLEVMGPFLGLRLQF